MFFFFSLWHECVVACCATLKYIDDRHKYEHTPLLDTVCLRVWCSFRQIRFQFRPFFSHRCLYSCDAMRAHSINRTDISSPKLALLSSLPLSNFVQPNGGVKRRNAWRNYRCAIIARSASLSAAKTERVCSVDRERMRDVALSFKRKMSFCLLAFACQFRRTVMPHDNSHGRSTLSCAISTLP